MASSGIPALSCLLIVSLMLQAKCEGSFVTVECQKSHIIAQYGTNTLLDCVIRAQKDDTEIVAITWKLNENPVLNFFKGKIDPVKPEFQFALKSPHKSNRNVSLLITNTNLEHAGEYECDVITDTGSNQARVRLTVKSNYSKPEIHSDPEEINPEKGFSLTCMAHGGYPKGTIKWVVDDSEWKINPEVQVKTNSNGLYSLTSTLLLNSNTAFRKFVCEVYNADGEKFQTEFNYIVNAQYAGKKEISLSHIVAPVVVIGSLIVGLLLALLWCKSRRREARRLSTAPLMKDDRPHPEERREMYRQDMGPV